MLLNTFSRSSSVPHQILQLVVDIQFSIPRVVLEPSLDQVYSLLMDMSSALLGTLRQVKWWVGPSTSRNLYDMLEVNGVIKSMQSAVSQAIQGQARLGLAGGRGWGSAWDSSLQGCIVIRQGLSRASCIRVRA